MDKDSRIIRIIKDVAANNNVTEKDVEKMVDSLYDFIYTTVTAPEYATMTLEEFKATKKNFMIPELMKFYADEAIFKKINRIDERRKEI